MITPSRTAMKNVSALIMGVMILVLLCPVIAVYSLFVGIFLPAQRAKRAPIAPKTS